MHNKNFVSFNFSEKVDILLYEIKPLEYKNSKLIDHPPPPQSLQTIVKSVQIETVIIRNYIRKTFLLELRQIILLLHIYKKKTLDTEKRWNIFQQV